MLFFFFEESSIHLLFTFLTKTSIESEKASIYSEKITSNELTRVSFEVTKSSIELTKASTELEKTSIGNDTVIGIDTDDELYNMIPRHYRLVRKKNWSYIPSTF